MLHNLPNFPAFLRKLRTEIGRCLRTAQLQNNNQKRTKERAELKQILTASDNLDDLGHFFLSMSKTLKKNPNYLQLKAYGYK